MDASSNRYRQFARGALGKTVNSAAPTHSQLLTAFQTLRERLARTLIPVFGSMAVDALFDRSRHLSTDEYPWLAELLPDRGGKAIDPSKVADLAAVDGLREGFATMLGHDIGLLVALVGEDFIMPLTHKAWGTAGRLSTGTSESN
jgi:hypothetical protein